MMLGSARFKTIKINSTLFKKPETVSRDERNRVGNSERKTSTSNGLNLTGKLNTEKISKFSVSLIDLIKENLLISFFVFLIIIGIIVGTIFAKNADEILLNILRSIFLNNYSLRSTQSLLETFSTSIVSSFIFVVLAVLMGMTMWGNITVPMLNFFKGFGLGISSGYLYLAYGFKGILFNLIVVFPGAFLSALALIISSKQAMKFSSILAFSGLRVKGKIREVPSVKIFLMNNCKSFIIVGISAAVDMLFSWWFAGLFKF